MKKIIIKLGGSVITYKEKFPPKVNFHYLKQLAKEIKIALSDAEHQMIIIHGAGCFGHIPAKKYELTKPKWHDNKKRGSVEIRILMEKLNKNVVDCLYKEGIPAIAFQASSGSILENKKLIQFPVRIIERYINHGLVPVIYGDISVDLVSGIDILSGDQILSYLAERINPDLVIIGTDVDGVFSENPHQYPEAKILPEINLRNLKNVISGLGGSSKTDVTGGMINKIKELLKLARQGIPTHIVNAKKKTYPKALQLEPCIGTWVKK